MLFSVFTELCNHQYHQFQNIFTNSKWNPPGASNLWSPGHMQPRLAVNETRHKIVHLLKTRWDFLCVWLCVFSVWPKATPLLSVWSRVAKRLDTPASCSSLPATLPPCPDPRVGSTTQLLSIYTDLSRQQTLYESGIRRMCSFVTGFFPLSIQCSSRFWHASVCYSFLLQNNILSQILFIHSSVVDIWVISTLWVLWMLGASMTIHVQISGWT